MSTVLFAARHPPPEVPRLSPPRPAQPHVDLRLLLTRIYHPTLVELGFDYSPTGFSEPIDDRRFAPKVPFHIYWFVSTVPHLLTSVAQWTDSENSSGKQLRRIPQEKGDKCKCSEDFIVCFSEEFSVGPRVARISLRQYN
jgi:hypothetical protein